MSDDTNQESSTDVSPITESTDATQDVDPASHSGSTWKVLGALDAPTGTGVFGHNTATSGSAVGVTGVTDSSDGFGLSTPDDANIEGTIEATSGHTLSVDGDATMHLGPHADVSGTLAGGNVIAGYTDNGVQNSASGATVAGGGADGSVTVPDIGSRANTNEVTGDWGTIGGGINNRAAGTSTVGGGVRNTASGDSATIAGGWQNIASDSNATVGGGSNNSASGSEATVPGGRDNTAGGDFSFAAGENADAAHSRTFVWSGSDSSSFSSTGPSQFLIDADGGVGINQPDPTTQLHVTEHDDSGTETDVSSYAGLFEMATTNDTAEVLALRTAYTGDPDFSTDFLACFDGNNNLLGTLEGDGTGGITLSSRGSDYAEYVERLDPAESIEAGDVVGIVGDAVTKRTDNAEQAMVVSDQAIVTGNAPGHGAEDRAAYETVAFAGQVPVKVRGGVEAGDLIVPSGEEDGTGRAVDPADWGPDVGPLVGRAWESDDTTGVSAVTVAVGIDDPTLVGTWMAAQQERIETVEAENDRLRDELEAKTERIDTLEERLAAVEAQLGRPATPADD